MLVIISDLHFVDGTSGAHNLRHEAFTKVFRSALVEAAKNNDAKEIKIVLLGDIVDLVRSTHWLEVPLKHRPWGAEGLADIEAYRDLTACGQRRPTEEICLRILGQLPDSGRKQDVAHKDTILYQNWETFSFFRDLSRTIHRYKELREIPVQIIYIPGNHDRMCNLYPSVRDELARIFGLTITADVVDQHSGHEWWYRYVFMDETYGVLARHGHQFDQANYAGRTHAEHVGRRQDNLQLPIGEVLTTEFAVRIPWEAAKHSVIGKELVHRLQDIDNVRPLGRVLEWLYWKLAGEAQREKISKKLDEIMDSVLVNLMAIEYVQQWRTPGLEIDELVRLLSGPALGPLLRRFLDVTKTEKLLQVILPLVEGERSQEEDTHVRAARLGEPLWGLNRKLRFVLYGHTHKPLIVPLASEEDREVVYINTGTWRKRIHRTIGLGKELEVKAGINVGFVDFKHLTYAFFYGPEEDGGVGGNKAKGTVSYDVWSGQMHKDYIPDNT